MRRMPGDSRCECEWCLHKVLAHINDHPIAPR